MDMDHYMQAVKLQSLIPEYQDKWILCFGQFHAVLCTMHAVGSAIKNSEIDDAWI